MKKQSEEQKQKEQTFSCANCKKKVEAESFPYSKEWVYLYAFKWKKAEKVRQSIIDSHFCSKKCLFDFLKKTA